MVDLIFLQCDSNSIDILFVTEQFYACTDFGCCFLKKCLGSGQIFTGKKIIRHGLLRHTCHVKTSQKILEFQTFTEFISFRGIEISDPCLLIGELDRTLCIDRCQRFT